MELELLREYFPDGTNGEIVKAGESICYTIELPWKNNAHQISCIPEGKYLLINRYTKELGWHLQVLNVPDRSGILIHAANVALKELKGCIGPVSALTKHGCGTNSRKALKKLIAEILEVSENEPVYLIIKKKVT